MGKSTGLGDNFYVGGYNLSGDTQSLGNVGGGPQTIDVTGIDKSAHERIGGLRDGRIEWVSFFDDAAGASHPALSALPTADVVASYFRGTAVGNAAASIVAKQINYDGTRATDGQFTFAVQAQSNGYGLVWGRQLTAGLKTDTAGTNGTSLDTTASASFGWALAVHCTAFSGTSVTIKVQDSADNSSWSDVTGATTTAISAVGAQFVIASSSTATVRRYVRYVSSGTFSSATFAVNFVKGEGSALVL
jgi:hypothetical protein